MPNPDPVIAVQLTRSTWADVVKATRAGALWAMPQRCAQWSNIADAIERAIAPGDELTERKG